MTVCLAYIWLLNSVQMHKNRVKSADQVRTAIKLLDCLFVLYCDQSISIVRMLHTALCKGVYPKLTCSSQSAS